MFEGSLCKEWNGNDCSAVVRSDYKWPLFEYCHPDYDSSPSDQAKLTGGKDICGQRRVTGHAVIGKLNFIFDFLDRRRA